MTTYHGITKITCRECGWSTVDAFTMEVINDEEGNCPTCDRNTLTFDYANDPSEDYGDDASICECCQLSKVDVTFATPGDLNSAQWCKACRAQPRDINGDALPADLFNMDDVAALIVGMGVPAYVEMTGGGVATIYTGTPDADGYHTVAAGPGTYQHRDHGVSVGYRGEFGYGADGDETDWNEIDPKATPSAIAAAIVTHHHAILATR